MKPLIVVLSLIVSRSLATGQPDWVSLNGPVGGTINDLFRSIDGSVYAAADIGGMYRTTDFGENWMKVPTDFPSSSDRVTSVSQSPGGSMFAGTSSGKILRSTDNGLAWTEVYNGGLNRTVFEFVFDQTGSIYAAVTNDGLLKSTNDGGSWQLLPGIDANITAAVVNANNVLFATDSYGNYIRESTDQGASWTPIGFNTIILHLALNDSNQLCAGSQYGVLRYRNETWELLNNGLPPDFPINVKALAFGQNGTGYCIVKDTAIYRTTNNGESWTRFDQGFFSDMKRLSLLTTGNDLLVGMELSGVAGSVSGASLTRRNEGLVATTVLSVAAAGSRVVALTADRISWTTESSSRSLGVLWNDRCMPEPFNSLDLKKEDRGIAWQPFADKKLKFDLRIPAFIVEMETPILSREWNTELSPNTQFKVDINGQVFISMDTMDTWIPTIGAPPGANLLAHNRVTGDQYVAFFGGVFRYNPQTNTWEPYATTLQPVLAMSANVVTGGVIVELPLGQIQEWTPGFGWTPMMAGIPSGYYPTGKIRTDPQGISYETFSNIAGTDLLARRWTGTMWEGIPSMPDNLRISDLYVAAQALYAATEGGGVWKMDILSSVDGGEAPTGFVLHQNYPNPFNPSTRIAYRVRSRQLVTLNVYDLLGREVQTLVNEVKETGEHSVMLDGSHLSSGVYFYRMQAGEFVQTRKLVLLR